MGDDEKLLILVYGLLGSISFLIGFFSSIIVNIRYALIASVSGMVFGGSTYIITTHWTFGYMIGGIVTLIVGSILGIYNVVKKYDLANTFIPHHEEDKKSRYRSKELSRTSGNWK